MQQKVNKRVVSNKCAGQKISKIVVQMLKKILKILGKPFGQIIEMDFGDSLSVMFLSVIRGLSSKVFLA